MKTDKYIKQRAEFCKLALNNPKKAAEELRSLAVSLENCRNTNDTIYALTNIYACTERTIFRYLVR